MTSADYDDALQRTDALIDELRKMATHQNQKVCPGEEPQSTSVSQDSLSPLHLHQKKLQELSTHFKELRSAHQAYNLAIKSQG